MAETAEKTGRVRAWILVQAQSPQAAARKLYDALGHKGGDSFVVIRADIVDHNYNVMVPVDAESWEVVDEVHDKIRELTGAEETLAVRVVKHIPFPPHVAHGFVDPEEAEVTPFVSPEPGKAGRVKPEVGRLGNSPGHNAWG